MGLKLQLKSGQKIIINGAVVQNIGKSSAVLLLHNNALILRDSDVITAEEAVTPASRIYYGVQCLYLFPDEALPNASVLNDLIVAYLEAAPSAKDIMVRLTEQLASGNFYQALRVARELIDHEGRVLRGETAGKESS